MHRYWRILLLAGGLLAAAPASAQAWMGPIVGEMVGDAMQHLRQEKACMEGHWIVSRRAVPEAFAVMRDYVGRAGAGPGVDVSRLFTGKAKLREWRHGDELGDVKAIRDPFAQAIRARGLAFGGPEAVLWSMDGYLPMAIWRVERTAPGQPAQFYRVIFRHEAGVWKLQKVELIESVEPPPLERFCHKPGDVEAYRLAHPVVDAAALKAHGDKELGERDAVWRRRLDAQEARGSAPARPQTPEQQKQLDRQNGFSARLDGPAARR